MKHALILIFLLYNITAKATTYTVTSSADSGPGTLRDAIIQAAASSAGFPNLIVFNIADQSQAGRTITLQSTLPPLSSNLTIDGTTQPGVPFGISNARVIITNPYTLQYVYYFNILGVTNLQVYGLWLQGVAAGYAFHFRESTNLQFGAPGKGNIISGFAEAFNCDIINVADAKSNNVLIQSNIMGTDPTGMIAAFNGIDFDFINVANLQIGGLNDGEGNLMVEQSYPMDYTWNRIDSFGYLNIEGNLQGTDITGNKRLCPNHSNFEINGANDGNSSFTGTTALTVNIINNVSVCGYDFFDISSPFKIQGNHIGVGIDNTTNFVTGTYSGTNFLLDFEFCNGGLIGGPAPGDKNYIAYNQAGVFEFWCNYITISRNSFFCNTVGIELDWQDPQRTAPFVNINLLTAGKVGGNALPNSIIELFYDDECPGCEGKTYIGTTTADNNGNWNYNIVATGAIVATATDTNGTTSPFSQATINTDSLIIKNATCGRKNGSIKNIQVASGTEWYWKDTLGKIVSTSKDLVNAGPGTYLFVTSIGGAACNATSTPYTITNIDLPSFDPGAVSITQPSCGQHNGAFRYPGAFDTSTVYRWQVAGNIVFPDFSTENPLTKLAPGSYTLQLLLKTDSTCSAEFGPFALTNQTGPSLTATSVLITASTCGRNNGALTGITYQNAVQPVFISWLDSSGKVYGKELNLVNAFAGTYRLAFKDGGGCDTLFSDWYTITDSGTITYDTSAMLITSASCGMSNGSVTGIKSNNATTFAWKNINTGNTVGTTEDLTQIGGGTYVLTLANGYGCQAQTPGIDIEQIPNPAIDYSDLHIAGDTCNTNIASILGLTMVDNSRTYSWIWYNLSQANGNPPGSVIGKTPGYLDSINSGNYQTIVTDQYGCTVTSNVFTPDNVELSPNVPKAKDQYIPRNTPATIRVINPQTGTYKLLESNIPGSAVIDSSVSGVLQTPDVPQDKTFYILYTRGDCTGPIAAVNIKVFDSVRINVPNAFTPNNDGINDRWHLLIQGLVVKIHIAVFDRWGTKVFSSDDPGMTWDGTFNGHLLSGVFVYTIEGADYYKPFRLKGTLVIIR